MTAVVEVVVEGLDILARQVLWEQMELLRIRERLAQQARQEKLDLKESRVLR